MSAAATGAAAGAAQGDASGAVAAPPAAPPVLLWVNGRRADPVAPHLSAMDRGLTLADGLFETMRLYAGAVFRLDRHLARLAAGARALGLTLPHDLPLMVEEALRDARAAGLREASVRLTVTRGVGTAPGLAPPAEVTPTIVLAVHALPVFPRAIYEHGLSARTARARRNEWAATAGVKTLAYTEAVIALAEARAAGADEALFLDTAGHLSEATASNVFLWVGDTLVTPPRTCGVLPGITREAVLELAPTLGLTAMERAIDARELEEASEAFLTSSLREIAPLVRVDGRAIGAGTVGPVTRRMMTAFAALARRACAP